MIAKSTKAMPPSTATRSASCGVIGAALAGLDHREPRVGSRAWRAIALHARESGDRPPVV